MIFSCWIDEDYCWFGSKSYSDPTEFVAQTPDMAAVQFFEECLWDGDMDQSITVRVKNHDGAILNYHVSVEPSFKVKLLS